MAGRSPKLTRRRRLYQNAMRNSAIALESYRYGWPIDTERQAKIAAEIRQAIESARERLEELLCQCDLDPDFRLKFNDRSPKQVAYLFYHVLGEPVRHKTATGADGTGKDSLQDIAAEGQPLAAEIAKCILEGRKFQKLEEAYITNLQGVSLVRPQAGVTRQCTGRWSYTSPALQTTPPRIKPMFTAHPGCYLVAADLSQAELRNMAQLSGDENMMAAYQRGEDIHAATAQIAFGCSPEESKTKPFRNPAKTVGLGYNYSVLKDENAAFGLLGNTLKAYPNCNLTYESMLGALKKLRAGRPGVREYKERLWANAQKLDYVEEIVSGRRRYFYGKPKDTNAFNFGCQALTAHIVDKAIQGIAGDFDSQFNEGFLLNRHDETVISGRNLYRLLDMVWRHLRQTIDINGHTLTYEIEIDVGNRWGEGMATIEPVPRAGQYPSSEAVCHCVFGKERETIVGLDAVTRWIEERIAPA